MDDIKTIRNLYPESEYEFDVAASRHREIPGNSAGNNYVRNFSNSTPVSTLNAGFAYLIDYTVENHGTSSANGAEIRFRLVPDGSTFDDGISLGAFWTNIPSGVSASGLVFLFLPQRQPETIV